MKRGNTNVFKLSGNLALGAGNQYPTNQNIARQGSYGTSSNSNTMKKPSGYGQSYQNTYDYNQKNNYDYSQKSGTSQTRKYSRNMNQTGGSGYSTGLSYGQSSAKKIDYNYQNSMNKMQSTESYNNKNYKNPTSYNQGNSYNQQQSYTNSGSYKDVQGSSNNINYQNRGYNQRQQRGYNQREQRGYNQRQQRGYQQEVPKTKSKLNQPEPQQYLNPNSRIPPKNTLIKPPASKNTYQQPPRNNYEEQYSNAKQQIKQYDPSTFVMCRQGCGRKFNPDSITKHQKVCKKVFQNKRPEFNVQEQRIVAKEQKKLMKQGEIIEKKIQQKKVIQQKKQNMPKWKAQSIGFRAALKVNRKGGQMTQQEKRIINEAQQAGMVKCKFCGRSFNQKAAERHIPFCETQQKKNALKKKK